MNHGKLENGVWRKVVSFNKAVLWKDRQISIGSFDANIRVPNADFIEFYDPKKHETWRATRDVVMSAWILKKEGQEEQYYVPIDVFTKIKDK